MGAVVPSRALWQCLYEGEPALASGLNFTSLLHGNFLALLAGLDLARVSCRRASPSVFIWKISSPPRRDLGELASLSCKRKQILQGNSQRGDITVKRVSPTGRSGSLPHEHCLSLPLVRLRLNRKSETSGTNWTPNASLGRCCFNNHNNN